MSIIKSVKNYLESCPNFAGKTVNINYLPSERGSFSIENVPKNPVVKRYSDGECLMQFCFLIAGRIVYDRDVLENLRISQFFEEFESWIEAQNSAKNLPDLSDLGFTAEAIEVTNSGTLYDTARTSARFQTVKVFSQMYEKLNYQKEVNLISEDEYYVKLERLRDRYFGKGTQNWLKYTAEIYEYQKRVLEEEKKNIISLYDDISEYASTKLSEVINKQASFAQSLKSAGNLFDKNTMTFDNETVTYYSMHDMQKDIDRIKEYVRLTEDFSERAKGIGISDDIQKDFLSELKGLDFGAALGLLRSIKGSTDSTVFNYLSAWNERNMLADAVAAKAYEDDFAEGIENSYEHMKEVLNRAGYEIPEGFFVSGSLSAQKFGDAFIEEIETQMSRIRSVIEAFNSEIGTYTAVMGGNTYNTSNTSYNIQSSDARDTVEEIRRFETIKRLSGVT